jgi:hypothetical protein
LDAIVFAVLAFEAVAATEVGIGFRCRLPGASTTPPLRPPLGPSLLAPLAGSTTSSVALVAVLAACVALLLPLPCCFAMESPN